MMTEIASSSESTRGRIVGDSSFVFFDADFSVVDLMTLPQYGHTLLTPSNWNEAPQLGHFIVSMTHLTF